MIEISEFNKIVVANWKLNASFKFIANYFNDLELNYKNSKNLWYYLPTFNLFTAS